MNVSSRLFASLWAAAGLLLVGCAAQMTPTATAVFVPPAPTPASTQEAAASTLSLVAQLPTPFAEPDTGCLECHTDAALLQALAEEEVVVKLSEGTG
jgi:hypothetical protein